MRAPAHSLLIPLLLACVAAAPLAQAQEKSLPALEADLSAAEGRFDAADSRVTNALWDLAIALNDAGQFDRAAPLYERILRNEELAYGPDSRSLLTALMHLAGNEMDRGRFADAEPHYLRLLAILEKAYGKDDVNLMTPLNALGTLYWRQERLPQSREFLERALALQEASKDQNAAYRIAIARQNLAVVLVASGEHARAEDLLDSARRHFEKEAKDDSDRSRHDLALCLRALARLYRATNREAQGAKANARADKLMLGIDPANLSRSRNNWGQRL